MTEHPDFDKLWDYGDPVATERRFREHLAEAGVEAGLEYRLQLQTQIARTLGLQGRPADALALLAEIEEHLDESTPVARVRWLLEKGRALNSSKQGDRGYALFREAWDDACANGLDFHAVDAAHMLNIVAPDREKLSWGEEAMAWAERAADPRAKGWLGALYNNMGWTYFEQGRLDEALETHRKGWEWRKDKGQPVPTRIAKWAYGRMLRAHGRHDEALALQEELLAEWTAAGSASGFVHEELAENLEALGRAPEAAPHWKEAWSLLQAETWIREEEPDRWSRLEARAHAAAGARAGAGGEAGGQAAGAGTTEPVDRGTGGDA